MNMCVDVICANIICFINENYKWIIPSGGLIVTIVVFIITQWDRKKIDSAQLTLKLNERLNNDEIKKIRKVIRSALDDKNESLEIVKDDPQKIGKSHGITELELVDYLDELEQIAMLVNHKVIDKEFAYQIFGGIFVSIAEYTPIKDFIQKQKDDKKDSYSHFTKAYEKFKRIEVKRNVRTIEYVAYLIKPSKH